MPDYRGQSNRASGSACAALTRSVPSAAAIIPRARRIAHGKRERFVFLPVKTRPCTRAAQPWFEGFDWNAMLARELEAPWKPTWKGNTDTSNFDRYDDDLPAPDANYRESTPVRLARNPLLPSHAALSRALCSSSHCPLRVRGARRAGLGHEVLKLQLA